MKRFKNILCIAEIGGVGEAALERAVTLAENNQAALTVAVVSEQVTAGIGMPVGGPISIDLQAAIVAENAKALEILVEPYRARVEIQTRGLVGTPFLAIIHDVLRNGYDLVIKNPENQEWLERLFSSDDMHLLRKCPCPVWLTKHREIKPYRRILAAVDLDGAYPPAELKSRWALNRLILEMAGSLALSDFAELHIVFAWEAIGEIVMRGEYLTVPEAKVVDYVERVRHEYAASLDRLMHEVTSRLGPDALQYLSPPTHLVKGSAQKEIPELARRIEADLVVMGTVARTGISGLFMGNTAETILNQIDCSVLAIKPPGFETPVTLPD